MMPLELDGCLPGSVGSLEPIAKNHRRLGGGGVEGEGGLYVVHSDGWMGEKEGAKAVDGRFQKVNPPGSNKAGDWETKGLKSTTTLVLDHFEWGRSGGSNWV